jgi:hypothetical protein
MQDQPSNVVLQALATLPGEPEATLADLLAWSMAGLASIEKRLSTAHLDLSDARASLREFKHIADGGSPRLASEIPSEGAR